MTEVRGYALEERVYGRRLPVVTLLLGECCPRSRGPRQRGGLGPELQLSGPGALMLLLTESVGRVGRATASDWRRMCARRHRA